MRLKFDLFNNADKSATVLEQTLYILSKEKQWSAHEQIRAEQEKINSEINRLNEEKQKIRNMQSKYSQYVNEATAFRFRLPTNANYEEELITKVARDFGESELELPENFVNEVRKYIKYWQGSPRMLNAMAR